MNPHTDNYECMKTVLHVGCGPYKPEKLHSLFRNGEWREVRLDIDPNVKPDIVASITDLSALSDGSVDAVFSSHNLEHLYPHEVPQALKEFRRVLKSPKGFALITLPDLQQVAQLIAEDKLDDPAYQSPAGPITPLDMLYGHRASLARGNLFMAHRTGFTAKTLAQSMAQAGFAQASVGRDGRFNLWGVGYVTVTEKSPNLNY